MDPTRDIQISTLIEIGICRDICVPVSHRLEATLGRAAFSSDPAIDRAMARLPMRGSEAGVGGTRCRIEPFGDGARLRVAITMPALGQNETVVVETGSDARISPPEARRDGDILHVDARITPARGMPLAIDRASVKLTVLSAGRAVEIRGCTF